MSTFAKPFVYFIKTKKGPIKIGYSSDVVKRRCAIGGEIVFVMEGGSFRESAVHFLLRDANVSGELFEDCDLVRSFIERASIGDCSGLVSDLPYYSFRHRPPCGRWQRDYFRPLKEVREALGFSHEEVAAGTGLALSTVMSADGLLAPHFLSGRMVQYIVTEARMAGFGLDSYHFTGFHNDELAWLLSQPDHEEDAA